MEIRIGEKKLVNDYITELMDLLSEDLKWPGHKEMHITKSWRGSDWETLKYEDTLRNSRRKHLKKG